MLIGWRTSIKGAVEFGHREDPWGTRGGSFVWGQVGDVSFFGRNIIIGCQEFQRCQWSQRKQTPVNERRLKWAPLGTLSEPDFIEQVRIQCPPDEFDPDSGVLTDVGKSVNNVSQLEVGQTGIPQGFLKIFQLSCTRLRQVLLTGWNPWYSYAVLLYCAVSVDVRKAAAACSRRLSPSSAALTGISHSCTLSSCAKHVSMMSGECQLCSAEMDPLVLIRNRRPKALL